MMQNMFRSRILAFVSVLVLLLIVSCSSPVIDEPVVNESLSCVVDKDCVADSCCHAKGAVGKAYAPDCSGMMCTMNCEPGTLDCGAGRVACVEGSCKVVFSESNTLQ